MRYVMAVLLMLLAFPLSSHAQTRQGFAFEADLAARTSVFVLRRRGVVGLQEEISRCYERKVELYCLYLDLAAGLAEARQASSLGFPRSDYRGNAKLGPRMGLALAVNGIRDNDKAWLNDVMTFIQIAVNSAFTEEASMRGR